MSKQPPIPPDGVDVLFVWNPGPFADAARAAGYGVAHTREDVVRMRRRVRWRGSPIAVLAEWAPPGEALTAFHGLRLLIELFEADSLVPRIALCSFASRVTFGSLGDEREQAALLMFPFVRLPSSRRDITSAASTSCPPSAMVQAWLRDHVLSPRPFAMWLHNFERAAGTEVRAFQLAVSELRRQVRKRRPLLVRVFAEFSAFEQLLDDAASVAEDGDTKRIAQLHAAISEQLSGVARSAIAAEQRSPEPFAVVLVEDDDVQRTKIADGLRRYFAHVSAFGTADAALDALKASDSAVPTLPKVRAVVSDWDLRDDGKPGGVMQRIQGPDFLVAAGEVCRGPLVGLTSLPAEVVASILNAAPADVRGRISWFPKRAPTDMGSYDYEGLAHHVLSGIQASQRYWEETPAADGKIHWSERGFGDHYVAVRGWSDEKQSAFFAECIARATTVLEAYGTSSTNADVSRPPFSLALNVPGSDSARRSHHFDRFRDILCGRLVVLMLFAQMPARERSYVSVLGRLHPELWDEHQPHRVPTSFHNMMSMMGIGTLKKSGIDLSRLRLLPHESAWFMAHNVELRPARFTAAERAAAELFSRVAEETVRSLERSLGLAAFDIDSEDVADEIGGDTPEIVAAESAASLIETAVDALAAANVDADKQERASALFKRNISDLLGSYGADLDPFYARKPEVKRRLRRVLELV